MGDRRLSPQYFLKDEPLVSTKNMTVNGVDVGPGGDIDPELPFRTKLSLWMSGRAVYKSQWGPTPVEDESSALERLVGMEALPGGYYLITSPWNPEGEKVRGKVQAERRRAAIIEYGDPKGVTVTEGKGGWYQIDAAWLPEAEKVQGEDAAEARAAELRADGPPDGFDPDALASLGDGFEHSYTFGDETVGIAALIGEAQTATGHDPAQWAELSTEDKASAVNAAIARRNEVLERKDAPPPADGAVVQPNPATEGQEQTSEGTGTENTPVPDFVSEESGSNGTYTITGPGLDEPLHFQGTAEALEEKLAELRAAHMTAAEKPGDEA